MRRTLAYALIPVTPALWSANYYVAAKAPGQVEPHALALLRWTIALALMLPFAWPALRRHGPPSRSEWIDGLILGALGMWICGAFVYIGGRTTSAVNIGLMYAMSPALIAAASALWLREHFGPRQSLGLVLALSGMLWIVLQGNFSDLGRVQWVEGDVWILCAVACWTLYSLLLRQRPSRLDPFARLTFITACGVIVLLPMTLLELLMTPVWHLTLHGLWLGLIAALLPGFGAYQAYSLMQKELGAARTGVVLYLQPLYAGTMSWLLLDQSIGAHHALGAALILPGIYLCTAPVRRT
ncbi:MAG: DMT family transporter [Betaproteobacteria bacterium]|nr:DMT family transporter [Betaproteobacteria bacterium]